MILVAVFLLLLMGTGTVFFVLWEKISESRGDGIASLENDKKNVLMREKKEVFPLKTFVVNLADTGGKRYLRVGIVLELDTAGLTSEINETLPQVRDKILMILPAKTFDDIKTSAGKTALKNQIVNELNSFLKEGKISNLYFEEFVVQ